MPHLNNWRPEMSDTELAWFDKCPKAVLFEIARQFGMRMADEFTPAAALVAMQREWSVLHQQGLVPQKPPRILDHLPAR